MERRHLRSSGHESNIYSAKIGAKRSELWNELMRKKGMIWGIAERVAGRGDLYALIC